MWNIEISFNDTIGASILYATASNCVCVLDAVRLQMYIWTILTIDFNMNEMYTRNVFIIAIKIDLQNN